MSAKLEICAYITRSLPEKEKSIRKCLSVQCGMYENSIAIQEYRIRFAIISYTCPLLKVLRTPEGILEIMNGGEQQRGGRFSEGCGVKGKGRAIHRQFLLMIGLTPTLDFRGEPHGGAR